MMPPPVCISGLSAPSDALEPIKLMTVSKKGNDIGGEKVNSSTGFGDVVNLLSRGLEKVNGVQKDAEHAIEDLVTGEANNLHDVIIAIQEANVSFQFAVKTRNKVIEAYQEVMRMQV